MAYVGSVTNPVAASGGSDEETQADAIMRAGSDIRSTNRAVTADDFEALSLETPGALVARAQALPLTDPAFLGIQVPGSVTVIVVPHRQVDDDPTLQTTSTGPPSPNQTTLQAVCAWLDQHRLVTTELHVIGPTYRTLLFDVTVYCAANADLGAVYAFIHALPSKPPCARSTRRRGTAAGGAGARPPMRPLPLRRS